MICSSNSGAITSHERENQDSAYLQGNGTQAIPQARRQVPPHGQDPFRGRHHAHRFRGRKREVAGADGLGLRKFHYRPLLAETFCDISHSSGTCYKAANWIPLGMTKGFSRVNRQECEESRQGQSSAAFVHGLPNLATSPRARPNRSPGTKRQKMGTHPGNGRLSRKGVQKQFRTPSETILNCF